MQDQDALIAAVGTQLPEETPAALVIDTLNRALRGSESSDIDMAAFIKAADAIREAFHCAVVIVHHTGKKRNGPRGHSSLEGAADAQFFVERQKGSFNGADTILTKVEFMKDGEEGATLFSRLEPVEIGVDDEGLPVTSCIILESTRPLDDRFEERSPADIALNILRGLTAEAKGPIAVKLWREECRAGEISGGGKRAQEIAFKKAKEKLIAAGVIAIDERERVTATQAPDESE